MIRVTCDRSRKLVTAHMSGFLELWEVAQFDRDKEAAVKAMGLRSGEYYQLIDTSECVIQAQTIVQAFQDLVINAPCKAKRMAIVRKSSLTRIQTARIIKNRKDAGLFQTLEEAEAWLFDDAVQMEKWRAAG